MTNRPLMRRTRWTDLVVPFVVVGITTYVLLRFSYTSYLQLKYLTPVPIAALALIELVAARRVRAVVRHEPHVRPMAAIVIARWIALGKASSVVGAAVAGGAVGMVVRLLPDVRMVELARHDATVAALLFAAALLLVLAGLLLERAGIDPGQERRNP
jgi:hypothetical protein